MFKIERGPAGEQVAYVRMFSGTVRPLDRLRFGGGTSGGGTSGGDPAGGVEEKVTAIRVFDSGAEPRPGPVSAGQIGQVRQDDSSEQIRVSLYGEVQKQVIEATLAHDFGVE